MLNIQKDYMKKFIYKFLIRKNPLLGPKNYGNDSVYMHDDFFIAEFPKSGITYLQFILSNIEVSLKELDEDVTFFNLYRFSPSVHRVRGSKITRHFDRTFIKTHFYFRSEYAHVIYLLREPVDVMVSYYNYQCDLGYLGSFSDFIRSDNFGVEIWKKHVESYTNRKTNDFYMHLITYEDLVAEPIMEIKMLYKNIGLTLDEKLIKQAIEKSTKSIMKNSETLMKKFNPANVINFVGSGGKRFSKSDILGEDEEYINGIDSGLYYKLKSSRN